MTTAANAAFYRDVLGLPPERAQHQDDVPTHLQPLTPEQADAVLAKLDPED